MPDEVEWNLSHIVSKPYLEAGYERQLITIRTPSDFTGAEESYNIAFDGNFMKLCLKGGLESLANPLFTELWLKDKGQTITESCSRMLAIADGAKALQYEGNLSQGVTIKDRVFIKKLAFEARESDDLLLPWVKLKDFVDENGKNQPTMFIFAALVC